MSEQSNAPPEFSTVDANSTRRASSELEDRVAAIWAEALEHTDGIGPEDSFFDLGGDSMSMMIVLFQIGEQFGVELSQAAFLQAASLKEFCAVLKSACNAPGDATGL